MKRSILCFANARSWTMAVFLAAPMAAALPLIALAESPPPESVMPRDATVVVRDGIATTVADQVMTAGDAFRRWDGQGELLLLPAAPLGTTQPPSAFTIGAVFEKDDSASADCYRAVGAIRLAHGDIQVELYPEASPTKGTLKVGVLEDSDAGRQTHTLTSGSCRFTLRATTKVLTDGRWGEVRRPSSKSSIFEETVYPSLNVVERMNNLTKSMMDKHRVDPTGFDESTKWQSSTYFKELIETAVRISLIGSSTRDESEQCPEVSGTILFTPEGIHIKAPWPSINTLTPGIFRDADRRTTTLILQNSQCRTEFQVTRETDVEGTWTRAPLSPIPVAFKEPAFKQP